VYFKHEVHGTFNTLFSKELLDIVKRKTIKVKEILHERSPGSPLLNQMYSLKSTMDFVR
jgi:hypothetical protein